MSIEKSNNLIRNRTHDLSACSLVPQATTLPRVPFDSRLQKKYLYTPKEIKPAPGPTKSPGASISGLKLVGHEAENTLHLMPRL
jgi:hypothetical protein